VRWRERGLGAGATESPASTSVVQASSPALARAALLAATPAGTTINFSVDWRCRIPPQRWPLRNRSPAPPAPPTASTSPPHNGGAVLTDRASVHQVSNWLAAKGLTVTSVTPDRLTVHASARRPRSKPRSARSSASTARDERGAPGTVAAERLQLGRGLISASRVSARALLTRPRSRAPSAPRGLQARSRRTDPAARRLSRGQACSSYWGQKHDEADPAYGAASRTAAYAVCGYKPAQVQAPTPDAAIAAGDNGKA